MATKGAAAIKAVQGTNYRIGSSARILCKFMSIQWIPFCSLNFPIHLICIYWSTWFIVYWNESRAKNIFHTGKIIFILALFSFFYRHHFWPDYDLNVSKQMLPVEQLLTGRLMEQESSILTRSNFLMRVMKDFFFPLNGSDL